MGNLIDDVKITSALDYASGTADRNGATLDMQNYDGVLVLVKFATIAASAVTSIKAQQGAQSDLSDAADLAGTAQSIADTDDDKTFYIDIFRPQERYVRVVIDKDATNATAEIALYVQYKGRKFNVATHGTGVAGEKFSSPAEGTA